MSVLKLKNTLTRKLDEITPLDGERVRLYTCGPTVYDYVHLGNLRTFVFQDLLRRYIRFRGFSLLHVMNITDVDDKIIEKAAEAGVPIQEYTERFIRAFFQDLESLHIERPEIIPRATEHIDDMVQMVLKLKEKGHAYTRDGSTYFRIGSFADYGKLSRLDLSGVAEAGDQVDADEYSKDNPRDFVLWKARRGEEPFWESPLGPGRPGWHLECSAMSMRYLGESFDLHGGGVDLVFPHHENEIAQSEAATGSPFVRHWIHSEFLLVEGEKMSKSLGNQYTLRDLLERGHDPLAVRYLLQSVHYGRQLNFTFEGLSQAAAALRRIQDFRLRLSEIPPGATENPEFSRLVDRTRTEFVAALDEDLNSSAALASIFELIRETHSLLDRGQAGTRNGEDVEGFLSEIHQVFPFFQGEEAPLEDEAIAGLIRERRHARAQRDFARADEIRDQLEDRGILLEDTQGGTRWKRAAPGPSTEG